MSEPIYIPAPHGVWVHYSINSKGDGEVLSIRRPVLGWVRDDDDDILVALVPGDGPWLIRADQESKDMAAGWIVTDGSAEPCGCTASKQDPGDVRYCMRCGGVVDL